MAARPRRLVGGDFVRLGLKVEDVSLSLPDLPDSISGLMFTADLTTTTVTLNDGYAEFQGIPVRISFTLPQAKEPIATAGEVVREAEAGAAPCYGIQFTSFVEVERQAIGRFVEDQLQQVSGD